MKKENERGKDKKGSKPYEKPALTKYKKISEWIRSGTTTPVSSPIGPG